MGQKQVKCPKTIDSVHTYYILEKYIIFINI